MGVEVIGRYDLTETRGEGHAAGLARFVEGAMGGLPRSERVVHVRSDDGRQVVEARLERVRLTDGSHVVNLVLTFDQDG